MTSRADGSVDVLDTICFVHWSARPDANEVQRVVNGIGAARRTAGRPLVLIALVPDNAERPDREGREALHRLAQIVDRMCDAQYAVFRGGTIRARIVRAFLVAIGLAMRSAVEVVADVETALELAGARLGVDPAVLIDRARTRGMIPRGRIFSVFETTSFGDREPSRRRDPCPSTKVNGKFGIRSRTGGNGCRIAIRGG